MVSFCRQSEAGVHLTEDIIGDSKGWKVYVSMKGHLETVERWLKG